MNLSISEDKKSQIFGDLKVANTTFNQMYRGDREYRQPIHTVYGGANLFKSNTTQVLGAIALKSLLLYAPDFIEFGKRLKIIESNITRIIDSSNKKESEILAMVDKSFLSDDAKKLYKNNVVENYKLFRQ